VTPTSATAGTHANDAALVPPPEDEEEMPEELYGPADPDEEMKIHGPLPALPTDEDAEPSEEEQPALPADEASAGNGDGAFGLGDAGETPDASNPFAAHMPACAGSEPDANNPFAAHMA
jgi:hypothetical protein